jgi:SNF2 family DNA or RNA helicase
MNKLEITGLLRKYQWDGVHFFLSQPSCLLADEMGLGKTVQAAVAISLLLPKTKSGRALIIVPAALRINWEQELSKWAPKLSVRRLRGDNLERIANYNLPINVLIASYEQIRQDAIVLNNMVRFDIVVLDEAQKIKNIHTETSLAVRTIQRDRSWAITGTPMENNVDDLIAILRFVKLDLLNPAMNRVEIHKLMKPYFLRRCKKDVLRELPPIIMQDISIELSPLQEKAYMKVWNDRHHLSQKGGKRISNTAIFSYITRLKQICNYDIESGESSKIDTLKLIIANFSERTDKLIVFSQYVKTLNFISERLKDKITHEIYHGGLSEDVRNDVTKRFQKEDGPRVLLISLKAWGLGLNLQAASAVVIFDRWWNPAIEEQAINRAHRFNRENVLHVFRFTVVNSIEEKIVQILSEKRSLFDQYVNKAESALMPSLNIRDLINIVESHDTNY